jgi:Asp/Glu/hydantoin racemase
MSSVKNPGPIVVINPNSNQAVTDGLSEALEPFRFPQGPAIECLTLAEGPFGIESQVDADSVVMPLVRLIERRPDAAAFVIACYSDPGIDSCRTAAKAPVFGMQESGVLTALARGDRVGIIAAAQPSVDRHRRYMRRMGVLDRVVAERPLNMTVDETVRGEGTFARLTEVGRQLVADGADAIILGCAGMARHRAPLEDVLGVPIVEPTQAAVAMALGAVMVART